MEKVRCSEVGCSRVGLGIVRFGNVGGCFGKVKYAIVTHGKVR